MPRAATWEALTATLVASMFDRAAISWFHDWVTVRSTARRWVSILIRSVLLRSIDWRTRELVRPPV